MLPDTDYPLDDLSLPTGGITLRTSDGVNLKAYKNILALASPFFRDMFTLPQTNDSNDGQQQSENDAQVIDVSESSATVKMLLRLIYPIAAPSFPGISEEGKVINGLELVNGVEPVLAAALKYEMQSVVEKICARLLDAAETTLPDGSVIDDTLAVRVYVLACQYKLKEVAHRAARASLKGRVAGVFVENLHRISGAHYYHLREFHAKIVDVALASLNSTARQYISCSRCGGGTTYSPTASRWWNRFSAKARPILSQSPGSAKIYCNAIRDEILMLASGCDSQDCKQAPSNWSTVSQRIKEAVETAIINNDIDVSGI